MQSQQERLAKGYEKSDCSCQTNTMIYVSLK